MPFAFRENKKNIGTGKDFETKRKCIIAKTPVNYASKIKNCLRFLKSRQLFKLLSASFCELFITITSFTTIDASGQRNDIFKKQLAYLYEEFLSIELLLE